MDNLVESVSALTVATKDMARAVEFYQALGLELIYGGRAAPFTSFRAGAGFINITSQPDKQWSWWGRCIFHVRDVDAMYERALSAGYQPSTTPRDAPWGERYFHISDPDGHELSFARPLQSASEPEGD